MYHPSTVQVLLFRNICMKYKCQIQHIKDSNTHDSIIWHFAELIKATLDTGGVRSIPNVSIFTSEPPRNSNILRTYNFSFMMQTEG